MLNVVCWVLINKQRQQFVRYSLSVSMLSLISEHTAVETVSSAFSGELSSG